MDGRQPQRIETLAAGDALAAVWGSLSLDVRQRLAEHAHVVERQPNELLTREGEPTADLAIVLDGRVAIRTRIEGREMLTILKVEPGDVIGWSAVVPPYRATSTATAVGPVRLLAFDAAELRHLLASEPDLAAEVYPQVLKAVARRLQGTRLQLLDLFTQRVEPW